MDRPSSPETVSSLVPASSYSSSRQTTYTTAGTIYRPSSSQPLQPPTRRGRSCRWAAGGLNTDLALLPKSSLSGHSGRTIPVRQNYTPLQQNYDRAISPFGEYDHPGLRMPVDIPHMRSANTPRPLSLTISESSQEKMVTDMEDHRSDGESDDDEDEDDFSMNALTNMTVKSLQSLASYPNPVQKRAQKALLRGCRPRPGVLPSLIGSPASASISNAPSSFISSSTQHEPGNALRRGLIDAFSSRTDNTWSSVKSMCAPSPSSLPRDNSTGSETSRASNTLASGCGTPLPLSAGPPGQRQYRPSTFESTFKALKVYSPAEISGHEDDERLLITNQTLRQAGIEDFSITQESFNSYFPDNLDSPGYQSTEMDFESLNLNSTLLSASFPDNDANNGHCHRYFDNMYQSMKLWDENEVLTQSKGWRDPSPEVRARYTYDGRLTAAALAARNEKLDKYWYSGVDMVCSGVVGSLLDRPGTGELIGERRPQELLYSPPATTVEEANQIPVSDHANVLLQIAINSLTQTQKIKLQTAGCGSAVKRHANTPPPIGTPPRKTNRCKVNGAESA